VPCERLANIDWIKSLASRSGQRFDFRNFDRNQIQSFCRFLGIGYLNPTFALRRALAKKAEILREDDVVRKFY